MKRLSGLMVVLLASAVVAFGQTPNKGEAKAEQELRGLVRSWDEAYVKRDTAKLDRLLAVEFAFVGGPKKAEYLASFKTTDFLVDSAVSTDVQVQVYDDAAVLTGIDTITGKNKGQTVMMKWLYMDVWIKRAGRWQCVKTYSAPVQK